MKTTTLAFRPGDINRFSTRASVLIRIMLFYGDMRDLVSMNLLNDAVLGMLKSTFFFSVIIMTISIALDIWSLHLFRTGWKWFLTTHAGHFKIFSDL